MKLRPVDLLVLLALAVVAECVRTGSLEKLESKLIRTMDVINEKSKIEIYGDMLSIEKIPLEEDTETARANTDPLVSRVETFLKTHRIHLQLPSDGSSAGLIGRALRQRNITMDLRGLIKEASEARAHLSKWSSRIMIAVVIMKIIVLPTMMAMVGGLGIGALATTSLALLVNMITFLSSALVPSTVSANYKVVKPHDFYHDHWHRSQEVNPEVNQPYRGWEPDYPGIQQYPYAQGP